MAVLLALAMPVLLLLASFGIERGLAEITRAELQTAVDAAALAGAAALPNVTDAVREAREYLGLNGADPRSSTVLVGNGTVLVKAGPVRVGRFLVVAQATAKAAVSVMGLGKRVVLVR